MQCMLVWRQIWRNLIFFILYYFLISLILKYRINPDPKLKILQHNIFVIAPEPYLIRLGRQLLFSVAKIANRSELEYLTNWLKNEGNIVRGLNFVENHFLINKKKWALLMVFSRPLLIFINFFWQIWRFFIL